MDATLYTVGHSNRSIEELVAILRSHRVAAVADVRSTPYSRWFPQFNREALWCALERSGLQYMFFGAELGGRVEDRSCYENGKLIYSRLGRTSRFQEGLTRLLRQMEHQRMALLCAEKDPLMCHRGILVARQVAALRHEVSHIVDRDRVESHSDSITRLLGLWQMETQHLFKTDDEVIDMAYELQGEKIAYATQDESLQGAGNLTS